MSLQICPNCKKENSYWRIYKEINVKHLSKWMSINCKFCNYEMKIDIKERSLLRNIFNWLLWITPSIIITFLAFVWKISFWLAILLVIIFHFVSMYFIIKNMNYKK